MEAVERLDAGFSDSPAHQSKVPGIERLREALNATAERLRDNYPYFHPLYAGQMLKPPHPVCEFGIEDLGVALRHRHAIEFSQSLP